MGKVLIACEESQTVCKAFRERGHEAYSCDIQEPSGGHPEWHIHGDAVAALQGGGKRIYQYKLEGINVDLSALITIKRLLERAIEQAKTELETSKKRYDSLKNLSKMTEDDAAKAAIATQMSAADELTSVLWRWKLDLENAWEAFTEKDWR